MHEACEIIAKLVDDKKINGKDAIILMHAVLNNNLKTSDWFNVPSASWWKDMKYTTANSASAGISGALYDSVLTTTTNP